MYTRDGVQSYILLGISATSNQIRCFMIISGLVLYYYSTLLILIQRYPQVRKQKTNTDKRNMLALVESTRVLT